MKLLIALLGLAMLSGCAANRAQWEATRDASEPATRAHNTQVGNLLCTHAEAMKRGVMVPVIGVGTITNSTGIFDYEGTGNYLPVDAGHMFVTNLKKSGLRVVTREGTTQSMIAWELDMAMKKMLSDKTMGLIEGGKDLIQVPYRVVPAGVLNGSDVLLMGSVNRLDFDTSSGGVEIFVNGYSIGRRSYNALVGMDLALVDSKTSEVVWAEQYEKTYFGIENKAGVFKYEAGNLVDINMGVQSNEPLHAGLADMVSFASFDIADHLLQAGCQ